MELTLQSLKDIPRADAAAETERTAALVHLSGELDQRLAAFSGGRQQRPLAAAMRRRLGQQTRRRHGWRRHG